MPSIVSTNSMKIYLDLQKALDTGEMHYVIIAAFKLVLLNGIRGLPHYLGAFFVGESVSVRFKGKEVRFMKTIMVCSVIPFVYIIIEKIYHIRYDFGIPAMLVIILLIILQKVDFNMINIWKKTFLVGLTVLTFQWLDVLPLLSGLAFGRGETSNDIKNFAILLDGQSFLQNSALVFFSLFLFTDILLFKLILDENNLRLVSEENRRNQEILMESNMRVLENRTYMELRHLVHDLKSPLTSIQALVGVIKLGLKEEKELIYLDKIEGSIDRMSSMISEILYENHKSPISTHDMLNLILSQISSSEYASLVVSNNYAPNLIITVNKIRFSRAIINLLENAYYAVDKNDGLLFITVTEDTIDDLLYTCIRVEDNGTGISQQQMKNIWQSGYSTRNSLGLGLDFVRKVIQDNSGFVHMDSVEDCGTKVSINIPAEYSVNEI